MSSLSQSAELLSDDRVSRGRVSGFHSQTPHEGPVLNCDIGSGNLRQEPRQSPTGPRMMKRKKNCGCGRGTRLQWSYGPYLSIRICQSCAKRAGIWPVGKSGVVVK